MTRTTTGRGARRGSSCERWNQKAQDQAAAETDRRSLARPGSLYRMRRVVLDAPGRLPLQAHSVHLRDLSPAKGGQ